MTEDHGAPEAGQLPRAWTGGRRETESPKSVRRKKSVAGQFRMKYAVSWDECPQALHEGFSILPYLEIRAYQKAVSVVAKTREGTVSVTRKHKFLSGKRRNL